MTEQDRPSKKSSSKNSKEPELGGLPAPLSVEQAVLVCDDDTFHFKSTRRIAKSHDIIAQNRAVRAINMGLGIRKPGYNIYVAGIQGTGKTSVIRAFLEKWSTDAPSPPDWVYVYDFHTPEVPKAMKFPSGGARVFQKKMDHLIKSLRKVIPQALQGEDYENTVNAHISASSDRKAKLFTGLEKRAKTMDFQIKSSNLGIETIPIVNGRPLTEKDYAKLSDAQRDGIEDRRSELEPEVLDFARKVRTIDQETKEYVEKLRGEIGLIAVSQLIDPLFDEFKENEQIVEYLKNVKEHVLENLLNFVDQEEPEEPNDLEYMEERDPLRYYKVNVFVDNKKTKGAPVIIETNPTYYNLFGKIEKNVEHGMYLTDFTMIKSGSIHRADGGYLVLNAMDIFRTPSVWETLKRVLKNRLGFIEDMGEQYSLLPTSGLRPEPIPLDVKVILIGNDDIYHILYDDDEDFHKIFKMKADFDIKMERNQENMEAYVSFIATRSHVEDLLPFDRSGVAAVIEYGSRLVDDQRFISTQFGEIKDLTIEADYIAREANAKIIEREHVEEALNQKFYRVNLVEEQLLEMVKNEDILLSVDGERVGQVNGISVYDMGDYSFGKPSRISCTTAISDDGIVNVERASKLSGKIHDKGVYILTGFLNAIFARDTSLGFSASVCFEQSYGMVDGDSATTAELVSIISSMAEISVRQNLAMTGSLNQLGDVQAIGGVNQKIEGCYKVYELIGKGRDFSVIIPYQNVPNLMLHKDVRKAVGEGWFKIYPVRYFWEAFELATGVPFGISSIFDKTFKPDSALDRIAKKLEQIEKKKQDELAAMCPAFAKEERKPKES